MEQLYTFQNELKLDLKKLFNFFRLSSLFSRFSITSFLIFIISFILFPFIYLFIFFIFIYKYFAKYFFLLIDIIFFSIFSDFAIISHYDNVVYYLRLFIYDLWFTIIPLWIHKLLASITKEYMNKLVLKLLIFLDTKAFNLFVYFERQIPRWWYHFKKASFKMIYRFYKYKSYITTVEGQLCIRRIYRGLRSRWLSYLLFFFFRNLRTLKVLVAYYFLQTLYFIYFLKQKFVLSINLLINLSIYKFIKLIYFLFFTFISFFSKIVELIFGY